MLASRTTTTPAAPARYPARDRPGSIAYASLGNGSTSHLTMEALQMASGIKLNHIPFKGAAEAQTQVIAGGIQVMSDTIPGLLAHLKSGRLRAIGVASAQRSPFAPDVPTIAEQNYPGFESVGWIGMAAPAKTPPAVLDRLNAEIGRMLANAEVQQRLASLAFVAVGGSREQFGAFMKAEIEKWSEVARKTGAKAD